MVFDASPMPIYGLGLLNVSMRIRKRGRQIALEDRLIALDDKEWIGLLGTQQVLEVTVGMQRVKGADPSGNGKRGQTFARLRNLIGFFADRQLRPHALFCGG